MQRIPPVDRDNAPAQSQKLLEGVEKKLGMVPNLVATMAQSPAVAQAYLSFSQALSGGVLPPRLREQIALVVGQANECGYCVAAHSAIGKSVGLTDDELRDARSANSPDRKTEAALRFARAIVDDRGFVSDRDLEAVRATGYSDTEITEIVGNVALNMFTNYFNHVAETEVDFPVVAGVSSR